MSRAAAARSVVGGGAVLAVLVGCVAIPTEGPVTAGVVGEAREQDGVVVFAQGPQNDDDPTRIVEGFLLASDAEVTGEFEVTRTFLADDERSEWDPGAKTVVARATEVEQTGDAQVTVQLDVTATVDAEGRYLEAPTDARETLRYELVQDARGDWRIAHAPDVVVVDARRFDQQFRAASIHFLTPDARMLVPEVRWFRNHNVPTAAVRALLAGPSPWLRDAVVTVVPPGTELKPQAVSTERGGLAQMTLEPGRLVQAADRGLLLAQLDATLRPLRVKELAVRAGAGGPVLEGGPQALSVAQGGELEVLVAGETLHVVAGAPVPVADVRPVEGAAPSSPARSADGVVRVALADPDRLVTVPVPGAEQRLLLEGTNLAAPSVDRHAWVWTASASSPGRLDAVRPDGASAPVVVEWLAGRVVEALRVSRDGTRVAVVSRGADGTRLEVAGIVRDPTGMPLTVGPAVRAGASLRPTASVVWVDDAELGVLSAGDAGTTPYVVPVSGASRPLPAVADVRHLAVDRGVLHVVTDDGDLLRHDGGTWVPVAGVTGVVDVAGASFPG